MTTNFDIKPRFEIEANIICESNSDVVGGEMSGPEFEQHLKCLHVSLSIRAPMYWWSDFDSLKPSIDQTINLKLTDYMFADGYECGDIEGVDIEYLGLQICNSSNVFEIIRKIPMGAMHQRYIKADYSFVRNAIIKRGDSHYPHWRSLFMSLMAQLKYSHILKGIYENHVK